MQSAMIAEIRQDFISSRPASSSFPFHHLLQSFKVSLADGHAKAHGSKHLVN